MRRRITALLLILVLAGGTLTGCKSLQKEEESQPMNSKARIKDEQGRMELEELDQTYMDGLKEFSYRVFHAMEDGENIFLSPYSIATALSMLYNGADQDTRREMARLLGFDQLEGYTPAYKEAANHYMNANHRLLKEQLQAADPKVKIDSANSIWLAKGKEFSNQIETALLAPARYDYEGDIFEVDFTIAETLDTLNQWVSDKTMGMIDPFMERFADSENIRVFLANAVYFNGTWKLPFEPRDTREAAFYGEEKISQVDMMKLYHEKFRFYSEGGIQGIELPYGNGRIVMDILIPEDKEQSIWELYQGLSVNELEDFFEKLDKANKIEIDHLGLPRFEMEYGLVDIKDALERMGMNKAFQPEGADFELIGERLYVSSVAHKAKIRVEEWGTEASAATGIEVDKTADIMKPQIKFIVDVPFLFFIRDTATGTLLFLGSVKQL